MTKHDPQTIRKSPNKHGTPSITGYRFWPSAEIKIESIAPLGIVPAARVKSPFSIASLIARISLSLSNNSKLEPDSGQRSGKLARLLEFINNIPKGIKKENEIIPIMISLHKKKMKTLNTYGSEHSCKTTNCRG